MVLGFEGPACQWILETRLYEWLKHRGYLDDRPVGAYADIVLSAAQQGPHVPTISNRIPGVSWIEPTPLSDD